MSWAGACQLIGSSAEITHATPACDALPHSNTSRAPDLSFATALGVGDLLTLFLERLRGLVEAHATGEENIATGPLNITNEQIKRVNFAAEYDVPWLGIKVVKFFVDINNRIQLCRVRTAPIPNFFLARFTSLVKTAKDQNREQHAQHLVGLVREYLGALRRRSDCKRIDDIVRQRGFNCAAAAKLLKSVLHDVGLESRIEIGFFKSQFHCWNIVGDELVDLTQSSEQPRAFYVAGFQWESV